MLLFAQCLKFSVVTCFNHLLLSKVIHLYKKQFSVEIIKCMKIANTINQMLNQNTSRFTRDESPKLNKLFVILVILVILVQLF